MFSKVKVKKGALDHFRKRARENYPLEIQAYLVGNVVSVDVIEIIGFAYTKNYASQTTGEVCWYVTDYEKLKDKIESKGNRIIGEIHSHPDWDCVMSPADYRASVTEQLVICGICSINDNKTRVRFWTPTSALPCEVIYYKK